MDLQKDFIETLSAFCTKKFLPNLITFKKSCTIKDLSLGDFNFPYALKTSNCSHNCVKRMCNCDDLSQFNFTDKDLECIIAASKEWLLQITKIICLENRLYFSLNRPSTYQTVIQTLSKDENLYGQLNEIFQNYSINVQCLDADDDTTISGYRCKIIKSVIVNLLKYTSCTIITTNNNCNLIIAVTYKSTCPVFDHLNGEKKKIFCGNVKDSTNSKKITNITAEDYIRKRSLDMQLMAQHKYGLRVKNEIILQNMVKKLGIAASIVDLLEVKCSSPVSINLINSIGATKGAAFILYNSARLETLFSTFEEKVASGYYPKLPKIEEIDFSLLKDDAEWNLMFSFVMEFPNLIARTISDIMNEKVATHLICNFLNGLVLAFSGYYRRVRILTKNVPHLLPVLFAKIYLISSIRIVLNKCLAILNIEPLRQM